MKKAFYTLFPLSLCHIFGLAALQVSVITFFFNRIYALIPLVLFGILTLAAPFLVRFGYFLPVVSRGRRENNEVALTIDDGPDPGFTPHLLELLQRYKIEATFFVTGENAEKNPALITEIISRGHTIGNHSYTHDPLLMLRTRRTLKDEIEKTREELQTRGVSPLAFRPPAGITNPRLWKVLLSLGMYCVNFSCRAFDRGNRNIDGLAQKILRKVKPGDIILLHDRMPGKDIDRDRLMGEMDELFSGIIKSGIKVVPLEVLTGKPVMADAGKEKADAVAAFYDGIAEIYDREQKDSPVSFVRNREYEIVSSRLFPALKPSGSVLEIGAGTGLYTRAIAGRCRDLTAVETSEKMLNILKGKTGDAGLTNIISVHADILTYQTGRKFDLVCSFSSFEYIADMEKLIVTISKWIKPGGSLYFTTANRSVFRFFGQIGNALRQGIWLHARSGKKIERILRGAGFTHIKINDHVMKTFFSQGILLEVSAVMKSNPEA